MFMSVLTVIGSTCADSWAYYGEVSASGSMDERRI
jgi:hypothetical protein